VLHDDLQQRLYAIQGRLDLLRQDLGGEGQAERVGDIDEILTWTGQAITATRNLAVDLAPPVLEGESLIDALGWLQSQMQEMHGFTVHIEENLEEGLGEGRRRTVGEEMRVLLFQVVRELLFNAVKYAETGEATVRIEHPPEPEDPPETEDPPDTEDPPETRAPLTIHVIDDGAGFDPDEALEDSGPSAGGMGLQRSRERLELLGGRLHVDTAPGKGTRVTIYMPGPSLE
jgi:signal transduction histidine kinase